MKKSIYEIILDSFALERCYFCGKLSSPICEKCFKSYCGFYLSERSGELQKMVDEFKLQSKRQNCRPLARLFADFLLSKEVFLQDRNKIVLIPVPTLSSHIRERGFDHTEMLAKNLSDMLNVQKIQIVQKIEKTSQRGADFKTRQIQAKKSYKFIGERLSQDKIYVILDDIRTTGATLDSIAEILHKNGARRIWAFYLLQQEK